MTAQQKSFFDNHPKVGELHFVSDGTPFFRIQDAQAHARGLADQHVQTIRRNEAVDEIEHVITEQDLANNPELRGQVEVGESVTLSGAVDPDQAPTDPSTDPLQTEADQQALEAFKSEDTKGKSKARPKKA